MSVVEAQAVRLVATRRREATGSVRIRTWRPRERTLRAARAVAGCLGLAIVSILIPVAHFVLVPGFLVAAPIAGVVLLRQHSGIAGGEGTCPACGKALTIIPGPTEWPLHEVCASCHEPVTVERLS